MEEIDLVDRLTAVSESLREENLILHASTVDEAIDEIEDLKEIVRNLQEKIKTLDNPVLM
jgi:uncharacterized coiled-coil DUF342 family protein